MKIEINKDIILREWRESDESRLANLANNQHLANNMMDRFPHPYTEEHARNWIEICQNEKKNVLRAIEYKGELVGGMGAHFKKDIHRYSVELGYWVAEAYWGKGIASACVKKFTAFLFENYKINRIYGEVFESNPASGKVLEKCGYQHEATLRKAAYKNGYFIDLLIYSKLK